MVQQIHNVMYCTYCCAINCDFRCILLLYHSVYLKDFYSLFTLIIHLFVYEFQLLSVFCVIYIYTTMWALQVPFLLSSSKTSFGGGAFRDNRILVLVHSTKRESASLPITGATKGASQKWYHAYKNNNRVTVRWWKTANNPLYGQALMVIQKKNDDAGFVSLET